MLPGVAGYAVTESTRESRVLAKSRSSWEILFALEELRELKKSNESFVMERG